MNLLNVYPIVQKQADKWVAMFDTDAGQYLVEFDNLTEAESFQETLA